MAAKRKKNRSKVQSAPAAETEDFSESAATETYLSRHNGNYIAAAMDYIEHCGLPAWARAVLRWTFLGLIVAIILGGLLWPFF